MKKTFITLAMLAIFTGGILAQESKSSGSSISGADLTDLSELNAYTLTSGVYAPQDRYGSYFQYYNNPEIRKLEAEVERLATLYHRDQHGDRNFSSDKYQNLTADEKKSVKNMMSYYSLEGYSVAVTTGRASKNPDKEKSVDQRAEEYFNSVVAQYLTGDKEKSVNKGRLLEDIKKKLNNLFEMKEAEKQKDVTKLEQQLKELQSTLAERKKNKQQIIDQRLNELIGLPNTLRW